MILTGIRLGIASKRMKSWSGRQVVFREEDTIKKVGVILDALDEKIARSFEEIFENFGSKKIVIETVFCMPSEKKAIPATGISFKASDIGWTGKIISAPVLAFVEQDLDLLITFTSERNKLAAFLMEASGATMKVSRGNEDAGNPDFIISTSVADVDIFLTELEKYLRIIYKST